MNEDFYENEIKKHFDRLDSLHSQADLSTDKELNFIVEQMGDTISKTEKTLKDYNIHNNLNNKNDQTKTKDIQRRLTDSKKRWKKLREKIKLLKKNNNDENNINDEGDDDTSNSIKYKTFNKLQLATRNTIEMENMSGNILLLRMITFCTLRRWAAPLRPMWSLAERGLTQAPSLPLQMLLPSRAQSMVAARAALCIIAPK